MGPWFLTQITLAHHILFPKAKLVSQDAQGFIMVLDDGLYHSGYLAVMVESAIQKTENTEGIRVCFLLHHITNLFSSSQKYIFIDIFCRSAT